MGRGEWKMDRGKGRMGNGKEKKGVTNVLDIRYDGLEH